jgi:GT2 family glycosyltransferase
LHIPLKIAVVICTKDRPADLNQCLVSLAMQDYPFCELVIVDASESDATRRLVKGFDMPHGPSIEYISSPRGLTLQRNTGIRRLRSEPDVVCFLDDDVEIEPGYLRNVARKFEADTEGRILGVCGNAANEKPRGIFDRMVRNLFMITDNRSGKILPSGDGGHIYSPRRDETVDVLSGCNMCYRREVFTQYGLAFDEVLTGYAFMEDHDFSFRVSKYGGLVQLADARLVHHVSPVSRPALRDLFENYIIHSFYIFRKNHSPQPFEYLCYGWRLVGKFLQAFQLTLKSRSVFPLSGWIFGLLRIRKLVKRVD